MNLLKNLRHVYKCDTLTELAKILGVPRNTVYGWRKLGVPDDKKNLLKIIYEQKKQILRMEEE